MSDQSRYSLPPRPHTQTHALTQIVDTQVAHISTSTVCAGFEVPYFRFDPPLSKVVSTGETDLNSLLDMMLVTKTTSGNWTQEVVEQLYKCVEARADFLESL